MNEYIGRRLANWAGVLRHSESLLKVVRMPNRLAHEKSPYLLQHADNPVDWMPWGEAAFAKARAEQKPIFLSIGYSTCHWCHVMAHESFENAEVADLLNRDFVPIKVDREERPDVDRVYMAYVQATTGHGGWPLSAWLTPELKPFYGGTYFAPEDSHGRHGFKTVLTALAQGWAKEKDNILAEGERVMGVLETHFAGRGAANSAASAGELPGVAAEAFGKAFQHFHETFDGGEGGFGGPPKFPRASNIDLLFRLAAMQGTTSPKGREALRMAELTLKKMAQGGIRDHVGGGFHRYSVDDEWFVPHFEKMLYDQAQIAINYLDAYRATGHEVYAWVARDTFEYMQRDLAAPTGGFYSAEDADSLVVAGGHEQAEGAFYLWTKLELEQALGDDAKFVCAHFDVQENGNVGPERDPHGEFTGRNLLRQTQSLAESSRLCGLTVDEANDRLLSALPRLREVRAGRPRPHLDDKIITAWNGLALSALALASRVLGEPAYAAAAVKTAEFVFHELFDEGRDVLFRSYRQGRSAVEGFAEDYAFLIQGVIDLYEATLDVRWLRWALRLQEKMDTLFWDEPVGGYFNSAAGDASIVLRLKEEYDGAEPAPSSVAAMNLMRLAPVSGDEAGFVERACRTVGAFRAQWSESPQALPHMLCALERVVESPGQIVLVGDPSAADFRELLAVVNQQTSTPRALFAASDAEGWAWLADRAPWLAAMRPVDGRATAYVCEHTTCQPPVTSAAKLRVLLV
jgi:uncharacterized protein YyaL (SSP411 family)